MTSAPKRRFARTAYLQQTLVEFDGPQVMLFRSDRGYPMLAVAVGDDDDEAYPIFMTEISDADLQRYLTEKVNLRYLYLQGSKKRYFADWDSLDEQGWVQVKRADDITNPVLFPGARFWARHHTRQIEGSVYVTDAVASFAIDGSWDASDFSKFYGKMADLYAFLALTTQTAATHLSADAISAAKQTVKKLGWRGGGSYVGFYDSIFASVQALRPLRVNRIQYASPGTIELKGSGEPLSDVARVVQQFGSETSALKESYSFVNRALGEAGLKTATTDAIFPSDAIAELVKSECYAMIANLGVEDPTTLWNLCDGNTVVFAKITLSFYRRARELYAFHAEGRVTAEEPDAVIIEKEPGEASNLKAGDVGDS